MNELEIKQFFAKKGLKIVDVADKMHGAFPDVSRAAIETMLYQLIAGQRWYPKYANWIKKTYGVTINKPAWIKPARERMKVAA